MYRMLAGVMTTMLLVAGCATAAAPRELEEARSAWGQAQASQANKVAPVQLLEARKALDAAERSLVDDGDTDMTRDLAYIAERRAQLAMAQAEVATNEARREQSDRDRERAQQQLTKNLSSELNQTRQQLSSSSQQIRSGQQELATERQRREAAERQAAAAMESLRQIATVTEETRGLVITLSGAVLFASGQATLLPIAQEKLNQVAQMLSENPGRTMVVEGHTDSRGSARTNEELSLRRASAVRDYLVSRGVPSDMIRAVGLGPTRPVADNASAEGRANNRRVEIVVEPTPGARPARG